MEITKEDREMKITDANGVIHKVVGKVITTKDGFDAEGNPKVSVEIKVPSVTVGVVAGKNN